MRYDCSKNILVQESVEYELKMWNQWFVSKDPLCYSTNKESAGNHKFYNKYREGTVIW